MFLLSSNLEAAAVCCVVSAPQKTSTDCGRNRCVPSQPAPPDGVAACADAVNAVKYTLSCSGLVSPACSACVERQKQPIDVA
jgi:hypothetical protein